MSWVWLHVDLAAMAIAGGSSAGSWVLPCRHNMVTALQEQSYGHSVMHMRMALQVQNFVHPVIFCGLGANAAAAALGAVQRQTHGDVLRNYMSQVSYWINKVQKRLYQTVFDKIFAILECVGDAESLVRCGAVGCACCRSCTASAASVRSQFCQPTIFAPVAWLDFGTG